MSNEKKKQEENISMSLYKNKSVAELMADADHDPDALHQIGMHYFNGTGEVKRDVDKALKLIHTAAANGSLNAQYWLHRFYGLGPKDQRDNVKSLEWATKAAERGHKGAEIFMRLYNSKGPGAPKGGTKSQEWCAFAAVNDVLSIARIEKLRERMHDIANAYEWDEERKMWIDEVGDELMELLTHS